MQKNTLGIWLLTVVIILPVRVFAEAAAQADENNAPRLEIRQYRFQQHRNKGFERLVLEFSGQSGSPQPTVRVTPTTGGEETDVFVDHATLMGAIPESLINDSYSTKSRYLGTLAVNADNPSTGFSLRVSPKSTNITVKAFWLTSPARLVIDAISGSRGNAGSLTINRRRPARPSNDRYLCFPASAQVGMNVVFQPLSNRKEELKNVRVNLQGSSETAEEVAPAPDTIVCYPRESQVVATLGFENTASMEQKKTASKTTTGKGTAPVAAQEESDNTLEPEAPPLVNSQPKTPSPSIIPAPPNAMLEPPPRTTTSSMPEAPAAASPASLLPPLR